MAKMSSKNRPLFTVIMVTSLIQMVLFALTPGIAKINAEVFPDLPLSAIQTAMMLPNLLSTVMALASAWVISINLMSKKACVVAGTAMIALTGLVVLVAHTQFWHLCLLSVLIGSGMGFYIAPSASIMFDRFNEEERCQTVGLQSSVINFGGILMSVGGGFLATLVWYGGYLVLLLAIPVVILCALMIPNDKKDRSAGHAGEEGRKKTKIPADVYYYGIISFFFLLLFNVCLTNLSNHLKASELGDTATAGIATAVQMAGGVCAGFFFNKLSIRFKDMLIPAAFILIFVSFTILNLGQHSLPLVFLGVFIVGTTMSIFVPQALFSTSNRLDASNSATATALVNCILPGLGGFLSPIVFTNLTTALGGPSTGFRFEFVGIVSLAVGLVLVWTTLLRARKEKAGREAAVQAE